MSSEYDVNFHFPIKVLESSRVRLVPFHPDIHGEVFYKASLPFPEIWKWVGFGPYASAAEFLDWFDNRIWRDPTHTLYAVFDKGADCGEDQLAGVIGFLNTSRENLSTEVGFVFTLPPFQRTHITTHAVGLLLNWCFDELKLRRVQWQADNRNEKSWKAAEKMGFIKEGVIRWQRLVPSAKSNAGVARQDDPKPECDGRHTAVLGVCWDDWENGVKERVQKRMARV